MTPSEEYEYLKKLTQTTTFKAMKIAKEHNLSMTANMCFFTKDKRGFLPEIAEKIYNDRTVYKKKMLEAKREVEAIKDELKRRKQ